MQTSPQKTSVMPLDTKDMGAAAAPDSSASPSPAAEPGSAPASRGEAASGVGAAPPRCAGHHHSRRSSSVAG